MTREAVRTGEGSSGAGRGSPLALGYEPLEDSEEGTRVSVPQGGDRRVEGLSDFRRARLVSAVLDVKPEIGWRLILLGADVERLALGARAALRARVAFVPSGGGLLSNLNAWENMVLPLGIHRPEGLGDAAAQIHAWLGELRLSPGDFLVKLPESMTRYEKLVTGYVRIMLEKPDLVLSEDPGGGFDAEERAALARLPTLYRASRPGGTFVQLGRAAAS